MSQHVFQPRDRCGPYLIERFLASGGIGQVYLARHEYTDRDVALKVLHPVHEHDPRVRRRMQVEARVTAGLRHPNLVAVHDANVTPEGICYIAMELLEGQSLRELLTVRKRLSPADAFFIAEKVARGVAAAHEIDVVHRDLKPENIWITSDRQIKVLDFGVAQWKDRGLVRTDPGIALGTPLYMAPEQLLAAVCDEESRPKVGPRADIYALGSIAHESIAGKPVWLRESISQMTTPPRSRDILMWHAVRAPVPLSTVIVGLPEVASAVIASALQRDPERRQRSMMELAAQLRRARLSCLERYPDAELMLDSDRDEGRRRAYSLPRLPERIADRLEVRGGTHAQRSKPRPARSAPGVPDHDTAPQQEAARLRIQLRGRLHSIFHTTSVGVKRSLPILLLIGVAVPIGTAAWWVTHANRAGPVATMSNATTPEATSSARPVGAPAAALAISAAPSFPAPPASVTVDAPPSKSPLTAPPRPGKPKPRRDDSFFRTMDDP